MPSIATSCRQSNELPTKKAADPKAGGLRLTLIYFPSR